MNPGIHSKSFKIQFDSNWFKKGDILIAGSNGVQVKVVKTYPFNWWRRLLFKLGFRITSCRVVKVKTIENEGNKI